MCHKSASRGCCARACCCCCKCQYRTPTLVLSCLCVHCHACGLVCGAHQRSNSKFSHRTTLQLAAMAGHLMALCACLVCYTPDAACAVVVARLMHIDALQCAHTSQPVYHPTSSYLGVGSANHIQPSSSSNDLARLAKPPNGRSDLHLCAAQHNQTAAL